MQVDLPIVISLVTAALTVGAAFARLGAVTERVKALEAFRERSGARLERLEVKAKFRRALTAPAGLQLQAVPEPINEEGSSDHG